MESKLFKRYLVSKLVEVSSSISVSLIVMVKVTINIIGSIDKEPLILRCTIEVKVEQG